MSARRASIAATLVASWVGLAPAPASAQATAEAFLHDRGPEHAVRGWVEMDPALAFGVGTMHAIAIDTDGFRRRLGVHADVSAIVDLSSWDLRGGVSMLVAEDAGPNMLVTTDLELKVAQNEVHTALAYGYGAALRPGYFAPVWYLAGEVSLHGTFAATVIHRAAYRAAFPAVEDGTYATDNLSFFFGGVVGFCINEVGLIGARFAWRVPRTGETYGPYLAPYTANLQGGVRF